MRRRALRRRWGRSLVLLIFLLSNACTYLENAGIQADYARIQESDPSMVNLKHMIDRDLYFVHGTVLDPEDQYGSAVFGVAALSDRFHEGELVDLMCGVTAGTHYGLGLPPGSYQLLALYDSDADGFFDADEVVGQRTMEIEEEGGTNKVMGNIDLELGPPQIIDRPLRIPVRVTVDLEQSLFYPAGTIRSIDDPLFDHEMSTLGLYHPTAFLEKAGTMFFALDEDYPHKIPVIFVHGINGSPRDFEAMFAKLDRTRFMPWFFYYPSGADLNQLAQIFYNIFFSGKLADPDERVPTVIVAHSMGGIVVREAMNTLPSDNTDEIIFFSIATPFGGHPAAANAEKSPLLVLPSWRDLDPENSFVQNLFRQDIPPSVSHHLITAYGNPKKVKFGENSDGVVPLSSQLHDPAQRQAFKQLSIDASHLGVLTDENTIDYVMDSVAQVRTKYPSEYMDYFREGGFDVPLDESYRPIQVYVLRAYGVYLRALALGEIEPVDAEQRKDLRAVIENTKPKTEVEKAWLKFISDYPNWREL